MTNEEAIRILKFHIPRGAINAGVNIDIRKVADEIAFDLAISALEKQIPKVAGCDICNDTSNWRYYRNKKYKYCPNCGQRLDWTE